MSKKYDEAIEVIGGVKQGPEVFIWRGRRYHVKLLIKRWRESGEAWDPQRARDLDFFRVEAVEGVYELTYDRLGENSNNQSLWRLTRVWD